MTGAADTALRPRPADTSRPHGAAVIREMGLLAGLELSQAEQFADQIIGEDRGLAEAMPSAWWAKKFDAAKRTLEALKVYQNPGHPQVSRPDTAKTYYEDKSYRDAVEGQHLGRWLKGAVQTGVDPDTLPPEEIERLRGGGLPQSDMDAATRRELYPSEDTYFKENPNVGGMVSEDDKVLLNPYSMLSAEEMKAVQLNEYSRLMMKQKDYRPGFDLTPGQASTLDATTYQNAPEQARRETIAARLLSGDPSGGTPTGDQLSFTKGLRDMLQEGQVTPEMEHFMRQHGVY